MPEKRHIDRAIEICRISGGEAHDFGGFNKAHGRRSSRRYPIRVDGVDYSTAAIFAEACRLEREEKGNSTPIPRWQGGLSSDIGLARQLLTIGVPIFDLELDRFVDRDDMVLAATDADERFETVPEPDDLTMADDMAEELQALAAEPMEALRVRLAETYRTEIERRRRSAIVVAIALRRANGKCEACAQTAPFMRRSGVPYLEVHHIDALSGGGEDHPDNCAALCPNCHREIHFGQNGVKVNNQLRFDVSCRESFSDDT